MMVEWFSPQLRLQDHRVGPAQQAQDPRHLRRQQPPRHTRHSRRPPISSRYHVVHVNIVG